MDKKDTYIVVFLADLHDPPKTTAKEELSKSFGKYIDEGLLTVILKVINYSCADDPISLHQLGQAHVF